MAISEVAKIRREIHQNPELSNQEFQTAEYIENFLHGCNIKTQRITPTGVIATIDTGKKGKVIGFRADMDALPIRERKESSYKSKNEGCMHACGHDGHVAIMLMHAKWVSENLSNLSGIFRFIFQPAEEAIGGAVPMIEAGALDNPKVEELYGVHLWSELEVGKIGLDAGPIMAGTCEFHATIKGVAGHGALPHTTIDPIVCASSFILNTQTIVSRNVNPLKSAVISFGKIKGGEVLNAIASEVFLSGTIRAMEPEVLSLLKKRLSETLSATCTAFGADGELELNDGYIPLANSKSLYEKVLPLIDREVVSFTMMGAEDFAYYAKLIPSLFLFVGAGNKALGINKPHHHPEFDIDETSLEIALEILRKVTLYTKA